MKDNPDGRASCKFLHLHIICHPRLGTISSVQLLAAQRGPLLTCPPHIEREVTSWVQSYLEKRPQKVDPHLFYWDPLTPWHRELLEKISSIPWGETRTYQELGNTKNHARAVGRGCHTNPFPLFYPCHRVVSKDKSLGGFAFGGSLKSALLLHEGFS